ALELCFIDDSTGHQGVRQRNQLVFRVGQGGVDGCRQGVLFVSAVDEAEYFWAAAAVVECVTDAVEARLPRRDRILHSVLGRHATPDLLAFNDVRQRRYSDLLDRTDIFRGAHSFHFPSISAGPGEWPDGCR